MKERNLPIRSRLIAAMFFTTLSALLASSFVLFFYETRRSEDTTVQSLHTMAGIIASNSTAAVIYDDSQLAREILAGLRAEPDIARAALYDREGRLFAVYSPGKADPAPPPALPGPDGARFTYQQLDLYTPVVQGSTRVGTLFLQSNLGGMYRRLRVYGLVLAAVLAGGGILAFYLSKIFQRQISQPILNLAETARIVSERKDYSVRAEKRRGDEMGFVTDAFNAMLGQIQENHAVLRERELQMRLMTDNAAVFLCQIDRRHCFKFVNRAYARRYGLDASQIIGRPISDIIGPAAYDRVRERIDHALAGARVEYEIELPYSTLGRRWIHAVYEPVRGEDGEVADVVAVLTDTTERQQVATEVERARDEAINASRAKDDFLAALSHELRTPLNPILLLATEAVNNPELPPQVRLDFDTVRKNVELEARLIDDLLDLTRITSGKLVLKQETVDAHTVIWDALSTVQAEVTAKRIELGMALSAEGGAVVRGDAVRLQQVFWNVLKNAVKFTPEHGKITVATLVSTDRNSLVVKVTDTGIGISPDELGHVFEAFAQGDHARGAGYHRFGGLGLGLAISRKMVEMHGGRIRAESAGRNQGSTFVIELPLAERSCAPLSSPSPLPDWDGAAGAADHRRSVLLVEDHAPTRRVLQQLLERRSFRVLPAATVDQARQLADSERVDFVISDIGLPDGNGYDLMTELKQRHQLEGIALTGYGMESDIARSRATGFAAHLTKPVATQALDAAIAATLAIANRESNPRHA